MSTEGKCVAVKTAPDEIVVYAILSSCEEELKLLERNTTMLQNEIDIEYPRFYGRLKP